MESVTILRPPCAFVTVFMAKLKSLLGLISGSLLKVHLTTVPATETSCYERRMGRNEAHAKAQNRNMNQLPRVLNMDEKRSAIPSCIDTLRGVVFM